MLIPNQRHLFDIPADVAYLNCAYLAPQLKSITAAGIDGMRYKQHPWNTTPDDFFDAGERVRSKLGRLVGADPEGVALIPSVSFGVSVAASNTHVERGQSIVVLGEQFPSNVYPWWKVASDSDATLVTIDRSSGSLTESVLDAIDDNTAVVTIPQCHWTDGTLIDLSAVGRASRSVGATLIVDASQSLGAYALDFDDVQPDWVIAVAYKWLLGPYRTSYLWAAPGQRQGSSIELGWMGREDARDFSGLVEYTDEFLPGARRYDGGEFGDFMAMPMLEAALDQLNEWGVASISETMVDFTRRIEIEAEELGLIPAPQASRVPHLVGVRFPAGVPDGLQAKLRAAGVYVSMRGDSMRVAPYLYNTQDDIDRLFAVVRDLV